LTDSAASAALVAASSLLAPDGVLDFLLVAGVTAVVVLILGGLALWLTARTRQRRRAAQGTPTKV